MTLSALSVRWREAVAMHVGRVTGGLDWLVGSNCGAWSIGREWLIGKDGWKVGRKAGRTLSYLVVEDFWLAGAYSRVPGFQGK